jgi:hypothetical protein
VKKKKPASTPQATSFPVIALLTDFGLEDSYVGMMKGVILSINPNARIVDLSHHIQPHQILQAGYLLWSACSFFPRGSVFLAVVDPGVGSRRKIIAVKSGKHVFLAPDNGLLNLVLSDQKIIEAVEIDLIKAKRFVSPEVSSTFHGRDIFAPLAAHLSLGRRIQSFGERVRLDHIPSPLVSAKSGTSKPLVIHVDHFGNLVSNISGTLAKEIQTLAVGKALVNRWTQNYDDAPGKTPCMIVGSGGLIEIVVKKDHAAKLLGATVGMPVTIYWA